MKTLLILFASSSLYLAVGVCAGQAADKKFAADTTFVNAATTSKFYQQLRRQIDLYLDHARVNDCIIELNGVIDKTGHIGKLKTSYVASNYLTQHNVIRAISNMEPLKPATANGQPITQNIAFTIQFRNGGYWLTYKLEPLEPSAVRVEIQRKS